MYMLTLSTHLESGLDQTACVMAVWILMYVHTCAFNASDNFVCVIQFGAIWWSACGTEGANNRIH